MIEAATEAVCCQSTETSTNIEAMNIIARAICETARDGNGLTSRSLPLSSDSSCQPGKVARRMKQTKARIKAMMLDIVSIVKGREREGYAHQVWEHDHVLELTRQP